MGQKLFSVVVTGLEAALSGQANPLALAPTTNLHTSTTAQPHSSYLPVTSVSSILAMPLFDWRGGNSAVVESMVCI